ncbi:S-methyl-5'-thioinosine phosphorylase [Neisseria canis]|uniref:S-methyl-5'-thioinosine phosphorylase n=1 Tax=Neisseria canis TaxID=493 RepID=A0A1X3CZS2_9NEIS|nr:S-methyl-5'-thioinosine phosphorylase [Neisseria canis]OSI13128.1 5'-methylthioadenosine phosphorylase [Neisseria canis]VEF00924.1 S-methyl-5'-thioinosine phosphorylase [Neisseria canis]
MIAIIGGSGLTRLPELHITHRQIVRTPYGLPSSPVITGKLGSHEIVFLARHGLNHTLAPHEINYRANIWALDSLGITGIISVSAVSTLNGLPVGALVLPDDLIDYTYGRNDTFFEGENCEVTHIDFFYPYDAELRQLLLNHAQERNILIHHQAVYGCIQGPRLPTRAEVQRYKKDGVDILGMTGMPEAALARELDLPYVHLCGVIGKAGCENESPDFRNNQEHHAMQSIRQLLINM